MLFRSRAKLAYLIDATAAPVCIIAPVSSWAAAVTSSVPEGSGINGFTMFLRTIPYNYYAVLTIVMSLFLIFVDDYFNCLTVGSVMRPVTDRQKVSRAKLAYLIDATAAPICIIAPVSSWAAAVTSSEIGRAHV